MNVVHVVVAKGCNPPGIDQNVLLMAYKRGPEVQRLPRSHEPGFNEIEEVLPAMALGG